MLTYAAQARRRPDAPPTRIDPAFDVFAVPYVPACFSSASQYRSWLATASRINPGHSHFCADCTPEFQAMRLAQQRCEHPLTTFRVSADGFVDGVRPGCRTPLRRRPSASPPDNAVAAVTPESVSP